ncbi:MAG: hypothetical protein ABIB97_00505 [Patescibacteria group bacterium]
METVERLTPGDTIVVADPKTPSERILAGEYHLKGRFARLTDLGVGVQIEMVTGRSECMFNCSFDGQVPVPGDEFRLFVQDGATLKQVRFGVDD